MLNRWTQSNKVLNRKIKAKDKTMATLEGNLTTWRIADGILKTGRGRDGDLQRDDLTGILKSVSYVEGVRGDGEKYAQVEANLEDENGDDIRVKASVGLSAVASNVTAFGFVAGLLHCKEGDDIGIFPQQAAKAHEKYGVKPTFVTIGICSGGSRYKPVKVDRDEFAGATSRDKFPHALEAFKRLPFYKEREKAGEEVDYGILHTIQEDGIFPDPFGEAVEAYKMMLGQIQASITGIKEDIDSFSLFSADTYKEFEEWYAKAKSKPMPKVLQPFAKPKKTADDDYDPFAPRVSKPKKTTDEEYDPFADE